MKSLLLLSFDMAYNMVDLLWSHVLTPPLTVKLSENRCLRITAILLLSRRRAKKLLFNLYSFSTGLSSFIIL